MERHGLERSSVQPSTEHLAVQIRQFSFNCFQLQRSMVDSKMGDSQRKDQQSLRMFLSKFTDQNNRLKASSEQIFDELRQSRRLLTYVLSENTQAMEALKECFGENRATLIELHEALQTLRTHYLESQTQQPNVMATPTQNGTVVPTPTIPGNVMATPTQNGTVVPTPTIPGNVMATPTQNGTVVPTPTIPGNVMATPTQNGTVVPTPTIPGNVMATPTQNGTVVPTPTIPGNVMATPTQNGTVVPTPTIPGNVMTTETQQDNLLVAMKPQANVKTTSPQREHAMAKSSSTQERYFKSSIMSSLKIPTENHSSIADTNLQLTEIQQQDSAINKQSRGDLPKQLSSRSDTAHGDKLFESPIISSLKMPKTAFDNFHVKNKSKVSHSSISDTDLPPSDIQQLDSTMNKHSYGDLAEHFTSIDTGNTLEQEDDRQSSCADGISLNTVIKSGAMLFTSPVLQQSRNIVRDDEDYEQLSSIETDNNLGKEEDYQSSCTDGISLDTIIESGGMLFNSPVLSVPERSRRKLVRDHKDYETSMSETHSSSSSSHEDDLDSTDDSCSQDFSQDSGTHVVLFENRPSPKTKNNTTKSMSNNKTILFTSIRTPNTQARELHSQSQPEMVALCESKDNGTIHPTKTKSLSRPVIPKVVHIDPQGSTKTSKGVYERENIHWGSMRCPRGSTIIDFI
ncbi:uncharacterized protein LOC129923079 [Biomphalaria glabrata]|uniref:Uncharacterized protein LOC129923079 n=1 Tax=Biomphalaria glabrata TaxID=6526 RepID=A0A9W2YZH3_BIOGL|nr:uncharacterized protein LOC129923079 [Biomphalaria glabrata]